jgi:two-component system alkaline phosphatase synthesis response regulator PhoP
VIYSVEDDQAIRDLVVYALKQSGFEAQGFEEGQAFRQAMVKQLPDLVLIMLTAKGSELDKVRSLDAGADDYLIKPFSVMELLSRIRAVLRRAAPPEKLHTLALGSILMDLDRHTVLSDGEQVILTNKEYELLKCLLQSPQIVFTREKLLDQVWDITYYGDTRTVDAHIRSLRQKLKANAALIGTVRGVGYRLGGD